MEINRGNLESMRPVKFNELLVIFAEKEEKEIYEYVIVNRDNFKQVIYTSCNGRKE